MKASRKGRTGAAWLELLLALAFLALLLQLFPDLFFGLVTAFDFRHWSRSAWFGINILVLLSLVVARFGPEVLRAGKEWLQARSRHAQGQPQPVVSHARIDPREALRQEEKQRKVRRKQLVRRSMYVSGLAILMALVYAVLPDASRIAQRQTISPLYSECTGPQVFLDGTIGGYFRTRDDKDVTVTHVGYVDCDGKGLQVGHQVALFEANSSNFSNCKLVVETRVPYGNQMPLEHGFRWIRLGTPVTLKAGQFYLLAAEATKASGDKVYSSTTDEGRATEPTWYDRIIGSQPEHSRRPAQTKDPWPVVPSVSHETDSFNAVFGAANLGIEIAAHENPAE